jgi:hypothetical protein
VCARVGNQRSRGVLTARVRTDAVRSLRHQRRDLHQVTYPYLSEDRDSSYYQVVSDFGFPVRYTCVSFSLFPVFVSRSTEKAKKIHIFRCPITLRAENFVSVTLLSLCPSWLSLIASYIRVLSFSILLRALFVPLTDSTFPNNKLIHHIIRFAFASRHA